MAVRGSGGAHRGFVSRQPSQCTAGGRSSKGSRRVVDPFSKGEKTSRALFSPLLVQVLQVLGEDSPDDP
jgi:hypothetical protein